MMQIESFKAPFVRPSVVVRVVRVLKWHCGSRSCQQGRKDREGCQRRASEIRSESIKADFARKVERVDDGRTRGLERGNGCKSDLEKLAPRRSFKYIKVKSSVLSDIVTLAFQARSEIGNKACNFEARVPQLFDQS